MAKAKGGAKEARKITFGKRKGGNRGVALLTPGTRDKGVHRAVDRMKKMKVNEEAEYINESEDSHKAFQDHHNHHVAAFSGSRWLTWTN